MAPWTDAKILTERGIQWQTTFCAAVKDVFFGDSILGNFGSFVFGDKRSRSVLNNFIQSVAAKAEGQVPPEIEALLSILREVANSYRKPYGPTLFFDGDTPSVDE
jgi:hypothetical protein